MSPSTLLGLFLLPLAAAIAIALVGRPAGSALKFLVILFPLQAFGVIEAGFSIPWTYLALLAILFGALLKGNSFATRYIGSREIIIYWSIAVVATVIALFDTASAVSGLAETMRLRTGPWRSPVQLGLIFFHFSLFFLIVNYVRSRDDAAALLKIHLWTGAAICCLGIFQMTAFVLNLPFMQDITWSIDLLKNSATYEYGEVRYYTAGVANFATRATFNESLHLADYINSILPIVVAFWMSGSESLRRRFGLLTTPIVAFLGVIALFFTLSRSGWGGFAISLLVLTLYISPRLALIHLPLATVAASLVTALLVKVGFFAGTANSLTTVIIERFDLEAIFLGPRAQYFLVLLDSFTQNPIFGLGAGKFAVVAPAMTGSSEVHSAHGLLWAALADFGLLGFATLLTFFVVVLYHLHKAIRKEEPKSADRYIMIGLFASLCAMLFQSLFVFDRPPFHLIFLFGLAAVFIGRKDKKENLCAA